MMVYANDEFVTKKIVPTVAKEETLVGKREKTGYQAVCSPFQKPTNSWS